MPAGLASANGERVAGGFDRLTCANILDPFESPFERDMIFDPSATNTANLDTETENAAPSLTDGTSLGSPSRASLKIPQSSLTNPECSTCGLIFARFADLERHEKKHRPEREFQCTVAGCEYKGSYRKDKLKQHIKNRHRGLARG